MSDQEALNRIYSAILNSARKSQFISYSQLAQALEIEWTLARFPIYKYLDNLCELCIERQWPIIGSIVVNQKNIQTGILEDSNLKGLISATKKYGYKSNQLTHEFFNEQQQDTFKWAKSAPDALEIEEGESIRAIILGPMLDILRNLGGTATPSQVYEEFNNSSLIPEKLRNAKYKDGSSKLEKHVRWVRYYSAQADLIDGSQRGIWKLTQQGLNTNLDYKDSIALIQEVHRKLNSTEISELTSPPEDYDSLFGSPTRQFWFVGAYWDGDDQTARFTDEGIWQNGHEAKFADKVARMKPDDCIAIKSTYTMKYNLPFENYNKSVSCMAIKAIGRVTESTKDGTTVKVDWDLNFKPRVWYFYTYPYMTVAEAKQSERFARRLITFTFGNHKQDYEFWLRQPHWASQYKDAVEEIDIEEVERDTNDESTYGINDIHEDGCFISIDRISSIFESLKIKKNLILQGPPGTGKTWLASRLGYALLGTKSRKRVQDRMQKIQFHSSLSYEDFVRGWRPTSKGELSLVDGVFLESVESAMAAESDSPFILVIEEINRGNPAQIFGEMLTLIESDKRQQDNNMRLSYPQYTGERVSVPDNLYIIGTMNIADRSLALVDFALRRRFAFFTLQPTFNSQWRKWCKEQAGLNDSIVSHIQNALTELNYRIASDRTLGEEFRIGHSYVTPRAGMIIDDPQTWFANIVESELVPLLQEYWFDNPDSIDEAKKILSLAGG